MADKHASSNKVPLPNLESATTEELSAIHHAVVKKLAERAKAARPAGFDDQGHDSVIHYKS